MSGLGVVQRKLIIALMPTTFGDTHHLDGGSMFDPSRLSICPILTWNDFAPSTNSMRTVRDEVGITRVLDGPGKYSPRPVTSGDQAGALYHFDPGLYRLRVRSLR